MLEAEWQDTWAAFDRRHAGRAAPVVVKAIPVLPAMPEPPIEARPAVRARLRFRALTLATAMVAATALAFLAAPLGMAMADADGQVTAAPVDPALLRPMLQAALLAEALPAEGKRFSAGAERYLEAMAGEMTEALVARPETLAGLLRQGGSGRQGQAGIALAAAMKGSRPTEAGARRSAASGEAGSSRWRLFGLVLASN